MPRRGAKPSPRRISTTPRNVDPIRVISRAGITATKTASSSVHGAQGETVDQAHVAIGDTTGAAAAYVAMTRGRHSNTAHLVAESSEDARHQWGKVFSRDRADLGPAHAGQLVIDAIDRYGAAVPPPAPRLPATDYRRPTSQPSGIGL